MFVEAAFVAVARKLAVLFWHLLVAGKDYAFARPSLTAHKLRDLELLWRGPIASPRCHSAPRLRG